jgi:hypothetical protein
LGKHALILALANLSLGFCETGSMLVLIFNNECMHVTYSSQEDIPYYELWA